MGYVGQSGMRSKDKIHVRVRPMGHKWWAIVLDAKTGAQILVPSFEDLFRMILAIVHCENREYGHLPWPPARKVAAFLAACVREAQAATLPMDDAAYEAAWTRLDVEFQIKAGRERKRAPSTCRPSCDCDLCQEYPLSADRPQGQE
jgi:hypothetical protein